jgi:hypothetical protein
MNKTMQLKARIRNLALKNHVPAQAVLQNYMMERLLERISRSKYKDMVVLKGGVLIRYFSRNFIYLFDIQIGAKIIRYSSLPMLLIRKK